MDRGAWQATVHRVTRIGHHLAKLNHHSGIKPMSPVLQADSLPAEPSGKPQTTPTPPFWHQGPVLWKTIFHRLGEGVVWGWFKHVTSIVYFYATANLTGGMGPWPGGGDLWFKVYSKMCVDYIKILHHWYTFKALEYCQSRCQGMTVYVSPF